MDKAETYRKRADAVGKSLKKRNKQERVPLAKRQKALNAMADNEDWLDGKIKPKSK